MGIRANAEAHRVARLSPKKIYGGVKSKVAGNIKSIKKSQTKSFVGKSTSAAKMEISSSPFAQASASTNISKQRGVSGGTSEFKKNYKSKLANEQMEAIVANIKSRISQEKISKMSP